MKRAAIIQSSYIPWKGYFAIIGLVDEFILYDDAQYSKNDWRNRNLIKADGGTTWLTIPVLLNGRFGQTIRQVEIADARWALRHWKTIQARYARASHFPELAPILKRLYEAAGMQTHLSRVNELFLRAICDILGINTRITCSAEYERRGDRTERLVSLCQQTGSQEYLTGPSAKAYIDEKKFSDRGIRLYWMDYSGFPEYEQLFCPPFIHEVSIVDLLLNGGIEGAKVYMRKALDHCEAAVSGAAILNEV